MGWAMQTTLTTDFVLDALDMAIRRSPADAVIHHSDQGCQYTAMAFGRRCREAGVRPSMGSVGDAYDNAMCESFFATLECELLDRQRFETPAERPRGHLRFHRRLLQHASTALELRVSVAMAFERQHVDRAMEAAGAVDAKNASTSSLENAQNAFPTAPTATLFIWSRE